MGRVTALSHLSGAAFSGQTDTESSYRIAQLLDRIDCRLANTNEQLEEIFRLRYHAYLRDGGISPTPSRTFSDSYDDTGNAYLYGLYIDNDLASSIRIHVASKKKSALSCTRGLCRLFATRARCRQSLDRFNALYHRRKTGSPPSRIAICHSPA